ncbi:MAG: EVE domain-containing protein [Chloroflexi bacterium]|nr:EVE domain-containing protein [Chloroflexota bacterium]
MGKTYWMLVTTGENFEITRSHGFNVQGVDSTQRRKALRLNTDDRVLYYLSDIKRFAATATVTSSHFEENTRVWKHHRDAEVFPHRVKVRPDIALDPEQYIDAFAVAPRMEYVRKWPPEDWPLAFIGGLHIIPQKDFSFVEDEMRRVRSSQDLARGVRRRRNRRGRRRPQVEAGGREPVEATAEADVNGSSEEAEAEGEGEAAPQSEIVHQVEAPPQAEAAPGAGGDEEQPSP